MIDRRFLELRFTVKGVISSLPSGGNYDYGDQFILSADLNNSSYPDAKKNCIAMYDGENWKFVKPNIKTSTEAINLATGEILKYQYDGNGNEKWVVVGYVGACVFPYVVDKDVSNHSSVQGEIGTTYILTGADNNVYKVTEAGANGYSTLGSVPIGEKVAVIDGGKVYTVVENSGSAQFSVGYDYVLPNNLVLSSQTHKLYVSGSSNGNNLVSVNSGGESGELCIEKHVFTAAEITAEKFTLSNKAPASSVDTIVCFMNGGVHFASAKQDFKADHNASTKLITIDWSDYNYSWYDSAPRAGEVAIFQYYKE